MSLRKPTKFKGGGEKNSLYLLAMNGIKRGKQFGICGKNKIITVTPHS